MNITERLIQRNYSQGRFGASVQVVVGHTYNGKGTYLDGWFNNPIAQVSSHYSILKSGEIVRYVKEEDTAWHAGNWDANIHTIGIEHQDDGNPNDKERTNELYESTAQLIADIYRRYGLDIENRALIKPHKEYASTGCPAALDIDRIRQRVYEILHPAPVLDNLYKIRRGETQLGAFREKDNAFNLWCDNRDAKVLFNNKDITSEFKIMATNLEKQITDLQAKVEELQTTVTNQNKTIADQSQEIVSLTERAETAESSQAALQTKIEQLQLDLKASEEKLRNYNAIVKLLDKIASIFKKK